MIATRSPSSRNDINRKSPPLNNPEQKAWSLHEHLNDSNVEAFSDLRFVWVTDWVGYYQEIRTGLFHPSLKFGYELRKGHFGSVDVCRFPFTENVQGLVQNDQVSIHPDTSKLSTHVSVCIDRLHYRHLLVEYALADNALPGSNGVDFTIFAFSDSIWRTLIEAHVTKNRWIKFSVDLEGFRYQKTVFELIVGGHGTTSHDWLKVRFILY